MKIRIHKRGFETQVVEDAQLVVVYDDYDNPMYVSNQVNANNCIHAKAGSDDFEEVLKSFGIRLKVPYRTVKV